MGKILDIVTKIIQEVKNKKWLVKYTRTIIMVFQ